MASCARTPNVVGRVFFHNRKDCANSLCPSNRWTCWFRYAEYKDSLHRKVQAQKAALEEAAARKAKIDAHEKQIQRTQNVAARRIQVMIKRRASKWVGQESHFVAISPEEPDFQTALALVRRLFASTELGQRLQLCPAQRLAQSTGMLEDRTEQVSSSDDILQDPASPAEAETQGDTSAHQTRETEQPGQSDAFQTTTNVGMRLLPIDSLTSLNEALQKARAFGVPEDDPRICCEAAALRLVLQEREALRRMRCALQTLYLKPRDPVAASELKDAVSTHDEVRALEAARDAAEATSEAMVEALESKEVALEHSKANTFGGAVVQKDVPLPTSFPLYHAAYNHAFLEREFSTEEHVALRKCSEAQLVYLQNYDSACREVDAVLKSVAAGTDILGGDVEKLEDILMRHSTVEFRKMQHRAAQRIQASARGMLHRRRRNTNNNSTLLTHLDARSDAASRQSKNPVNRMETGHVRETQFTAAAASADRGSVSLADLEVPSEKKSDAENSLDISDAKARAVDEAFVHWLTPPYTSRALDSVASVEPTPDEIAAKVPAAVPRCGLLGEDCEMILTARSRLTELKTQRKAARRVLVALQDAQAVPPSRRDALDVEPLYSAGTAALESGVNPHNQVIVEAAAFVKETRRLEAVAKTLLHNVGTIACQRGRSRVDDIGTAMAVALEAGLDGGSAAIAAARNALATVQRELAGIQKLRQNAVRALAQRSFAMITAAIHEAVDEFGVREVHDVMQMARGIEETLRVDHLDQEELRNLKTLLAQHQRAEAEVRGAECINEFVLLMAAHVQR